MVQRRKLRSNDNEQECTDHARVTVYRKRGLVRARSHSLAVFDEKWKPGVTKIHGKHDRTTTAIWPNQYLGENVTGISRKRMSPLPCNEPVETSVQRQMQRETKTVYNMLRSVKQLRLFFAQCRWSKSASNLVVPEHVDTSMNPLVT